MILDENLNDISNEVVKDLKRENGTLKITFFVLILITIGFALFSLKVYSENNSCKKRIAELSNQIKIEEEELNLEYSIGYWFTNKPEKVNDSLLYNLLKENGAWYPDILVKQAKLESGNYTSGLFRRTNNLYGMKKVGKRNTTQAGVHNGYGVYNNWCLSALDRLLWDEFRFKGRKPTRKEYYKAMNIYAEANAYQKAINNVILNFKPNE